jgi:hypothetical protein
MLEVKPKIENFIGIAIKNAIELEAEELVKEAIKKMEKRVPEIVAGITVEIMQMAEMNIMQDKIIFTIRKK